MAYVVLAPSEVGQMGELLGCRYLVEEGYRILAQNYRKKWGEIDIIARKDGIICFFEVKTVSHETRTALQNAVSRGTYRPEERVDARKQRQIKRLIEGWCAATDYTGAVQLDVLGIRMVPREMYAEVTHLNQISPEL